MALEYISMRGMPDYTNDLELLRRKMDTYIQYVHPDKNVPLLGKYMIQQYIVPSPGVTGYGFGLRPDLLMSIIWAKNGLFGHPDHWYSSLPGSTSYKDYNPLNLKCGASAPIQVDNWADGVLLLCARIESFFLPKDGPRHGNGGYDPCYKQGNDHSYIRAMRRTPDDLYAACARLLGQLWVTPRTQQFVDKVLYFTEQIHKTAVSELPAGDIPITPGAWTEQPSTPTRIAPNPPPPAPEEGDSVIMVGIRENWWTIALAGIGTYLIVRAAQTQSKIDKEQR